MAKKKAPPVPPAAVGDVFAVPLADGRFTACRVLLVSASGLRLVVGCAWFGPKAPTTRTKALRTHLALTHHSWGGRPCAAWVLGPPPDDFVRIGTLPPGPADEALQEPGAGAWGFLQYQPLEQWRWDHPKAVPPPVVEKRPRGRFVLRRFNGDEVYRLKKAVMFAIASHAGGVTLWFEAVADDKRAKRCADTAELGMAPTAEVGVQLPALDAANLVGRTLSVPGTKTDAEDSCMSLMYYCEHEPLRKNKIAIVSRTADRFEVRWTAVTKDVNHYDGSKPSTKVEIEGEFRFKDYKKWAAMKPARRRSPN
jgi:hypothetical protein